MEYLIITYTYSILLPLAIIEGPIVTMAAAFLASLGYLNIYYVYGLVLLGDCVGDCLHYGIGRYGGRTLIMKYGKRFGVTPLKLEQTKTTYFTGSASLWKIITLSKVTQAPLSAVLVTCGLLRVNFNQFLLITTVTNVFKVLLFLLIGYYFGKSYPRISSYVEQSWLLLIPIVAGLIYFIYFRKRHERPPVSAL